MKVNLDYNGKTDTLIVVRENDGKPFQFAERGHDVDVTKLIDVSTGAQIGWTFYYFSDFFQDGQFVDEEGVLPGVDDIYELEKASGRTFTLQQLLEWAYRKLVKLPSAA